MSLRLPQGRLEFYRKRLDRQLQILRKRVTQKYVTKTNAKERGTRIIRSHYRDLMRFIRAYMKRKKVDYTTPDFEPDIKEAVESWNKIVDDL